MDHEAPTARFAAGAIFMTDDYLGRCDEGPVVLGRGWLSRQ